MPASKITSLQNTNIKNVIKLRDRAGRADAGLTIAEGLIEIQRAKDGDGAIKEVYICDDYIFEAPESSLLEGAKIFSVTEKIYDKMAYGNRTEGILAVVKPHPTSLEDIKLSENPLVVVLEQVEKPGNLGAVLRTCDGAGVDLLLIVNGITDLYNPNTVRSSLGTVFTVPTIWLDEESALQFLSENKLKICATLPDAKALYTQVDLSGPAAFVFGNEHAGLTEFWDKNSDVQIRIPMKGSADSLNVSATAGIVIYEAIRQRDG